MRELNFYGLLDTSDQVIDTFLNTTYPAIAHAIAPLITILVVLYWAMLGMRIYTGYAAIDWMAILNRVWMSIAVFSVLVWGAFSHQLYGFFLACVETLSAAALTGKPTSAMLEEMWLSVGSASAVLMGEQWASTGIALQGFGLFLLNCLLCTIIVALLAAAKFGLAATMLFLPVFAGMGLFRFTRAWAVNWGSMMLYCAALYVVVVMIVQAGFLMFEAPIGKIIETTRHAGMADLDVAKITYVYLIEGVLLVFLLQARGWAAILSRYACSQGSLAVTRWLQSGGR